MRRAPSTGRLGLALILAWKPKASDIRATPYDVEVTITDQSLNTVKAAWTVSATTDGFVFVDPKAKTNGTGTKADPFKSVAPLFALHGTTGPYGKDIVYFRGGTTVLSGPEAKGNVQLQGDGNPSGWLGYPGEDAAIDCSHSKVLVDAQDDVFVGGLHFENARNDVNNAHFFFFNQNAAQDRMTFFEDFFDHIGKGLVGSDNPAAVTFFNPGALRKDFTMVGCAIEDYEVPLVDAYAIKYGVVEDNTIGRGATAVAGQGIFLKSDIQDFSVRRNVSLVEDFTEGAVEVYMQAQRFTNAEIEVSYNLLMNADTDVTHAIMRYNWTGAPGANSDPNVYIYRNTIVGSKFAGLDYFPYTVHIENDVIEDLTGIQSSGANRVVVASQNLAGQPSDGFVDAAGNLVGPSAQYRGQRGYEIWAGGARLGPPTWR